MKETENRPLEDIPGKVVAEAEAIIPEIFPEIPFGKTITEADIRFPDIPFGKTAILILVGFVMYFGYLYLVGFGTVQAMLSHINLWLVVLAFAVAMAGNIFHAGGWWVLLRHMKYKISLGWAYLIYVSSIFFTNLVPSAALSGEVGKIYFVQKCVPETRVDRTFAAGLVSRLIEVVPTAAGAIIGMIYLSYRYSMPVWALVFCALVMLFIAFWVLFALAIMMNVRLLKATASWFLRVVKRTMKGRSTEAFENFVEAMVSQFDTSIKEISANWMVIVNALVLIFIAWMFDVLVAYIAFMAVGCTIPMGVIMTIYSVTVLISLVPTFIPGGLGYMDGLMNLLYNLAGVTPGNAFSGTFIIRLITLWFLTAVGCISTLVLVRITGKGRTDQKKLEKPAPRG